VLDKTPPTEVGSLLIGWKKVPIMSDYGSGDELLEDINADELLRSGTKHARSSSYDDHISQPAKRGRLKTTDSEAPDEYDSIAQSALRKYFGYDTFRHEQVRVHF